MAQTNSRECYAGRAIVSRRLADGAKDEAIGHIHRNFAERYEKLASDLEIDRPMLYCAAT